VFDIIAALGNCNRCFYTAQTHDHECGPQKKRLLAVAEPSSPFWIYNV